MKEDHSSDKQINTQNSNSSEPIAVAPKVTKAKSDSQSNQKKNTSKTVLLILTCGVVGFLGGSLGAQNNGIGSNTSTQTQQIIASESELINDIAKTVGPSVVSVNVSSTESRNSIFGGVGEVQQESAGTGVIISEDGVIITNRHVIPATTNNVSVTLSDGTTLENVEVIGRTNQEDTLDIAFLKITDKQGKTLKAATLGDSSKVVVGEKVVAIGNALGQFQNTVTSGIISGFGRNLQASDENGANLESLQNLFQTDTAINRGNSGGPLVNANSEVIAINTAVAGDAENIGFAIPISDIQGLIDSVLKEGKLLRPYLGVRYISLTDDVAYQYNLSVNRGAYLAPANPGTETVISGSPADKAGLEEKDIIVKVDDVSIDETNSLTSVLGRKSVGDKVTLTIVRNGEEIQKTAKLEVLPEN